MIKTLLQRIGAGVVLTLFSGLAFAQAKYNLQEPQTGIARDMYDLHTLVMIICLVIFVGVFGVMFYSIIKHRKSVGHKAAHFHENTTVEVIWTVIPFFILIFMAWPATKTVLAMRDSSASDMTIKVTGYQWKWSYEYLKGEGDLANVADGILMYSTLATPREQIYGTAEKGENYLLEVDNPLVVPVGKKVRLLITANDVLHAWWVPAFGVKQDAVPGFIRDTWFKVEKPGTYRGQCAELCGKEHGFMPIVVVAMEQTEFAQWAGKQNGGGIMTAAATPAAAAAPTPVAAPTPARTAVADGQGTYENVCAMCHAGGVAGAPKTGDKAAWAPRIATGMSALYASSLNGKGVMPPRGGNPGLSDAEVKAATDYLVQAAK
jgi:cytochrome c oxidase subunit 2